MASRHTRTSLTAIAMMLMVSFLIAPIALAEDNDKASSAAATSDSKEKASSTESTNSGASSGDQPIEGFDDVQSRAFVLVMNGKNDEAQYTIETALKQEKDPAKHQELTYLLAAIERMNESYDKAIGHLETLLGGLAPAKTTLDHQNRALLLKRIGDCYYGQRDIKPTLKNYREALSETKNLPGDNELISALLEAISGTLVYDKEYAEAESTGKQWLDLATEQAKSNRLEDVGALFWARIQMLGIYRHLNKEEERAKLWSGSTPLLDKLLALRATIDTADDISGLDKLKEEFEERYIQKFQPKTPAEYLWLANDFRFRSLPLIQWPATSGKPKAAILCIHGLGLENRAFTPFGRAMAARDYSVYALDVRGFGSWQTTQGQEDVQFRETLKDIGSILKLIKTRENGLPVFLLGESMGGAIALRGAADYGDEIAGVISSVPSAERFQERRMGLTVAFHLLQGKNKPFKVGDMVTDKATKIEELADRWKSDSKAKMDMSPKELIKFAVFMRTTKGECAKITTPVFIIQGLKDRLVKPEGTIELFEAVKGMDKNLFIIGTAEHLIFETFTPLPMLLDALSGWIDDHSHATVSKADSQ